MAQVAIVPATSVPHDEVPAMTTDRIDPVEVPVVKHPRNTAHHNEVSNGIRIAIRTNFLHQDHDEDPRRGFDPMIGMTDSTIIKWLRVKYEAMDSTLNERSRRRWVAVEAASLGKGGVSAVAEATGVSRNTIRAGLAELADKDSTPDRVRKPGGGRRRLIDKQPDLMAALEALVKPSPRGDPESPSRSNSISVRKLATELQRQGFEICPRSVANLLREAGYSAPRNRDSSEGRIH